MVACALVMAGCGATETDADRAARDGILLVGNGTDPKTLDPHLLVGLPEDNIVRALSEGLVVQDPDDSFKVRPGVAEKWSHDGAFKRWTFKLRKGAKWSNGTPVTAQDFIFSWKRALSPELEVEGAELLHVIRGGRAYNHGEIRNFADVGVSAPDPHTLIVEMEGPTPYFLPMLASTNFVPVNRSAVDAGGAVDSRTNRWADAGSYVGNGPFLLSEWKLHDYVLVERNPQYWDAQNVKLNAIRFIPIEEPRAEMDDFMKGKLHVTSTVPVDAIPQLRKTRPESLYTDELLGTYAYVFNVEKKPFNDPRVRRALALAIDRDVMIEEVMGGAERPLGGIIPPGMPDYEAIGAPETDLEEARRLLSEAGFEDPADFPQIDLLINRTTRHRRIAEMICSMWKKGLGINAVVREQNWKDYLDSIADGEFEVARSGWVANYNDPMALLDSFESGSLSNDMNWSDASFDALIRQARNTGDRTRRLAILQDAERLMLKQQPLIPLFTYSQTYLVDPRVKGWGHSVSGNHVYKFMSLASN